MSNQLKEFLSTVIDSNRYICPLCSTTRKKKTERTLSVTVEDEAVLYHCWHCKEQGAFSHEQLRQAAQPIPQKTTPPRAISVPKQSDDDNVKEYLAERGINYSRVKDKFKIVGGARYFNAKGDIPAGEVDAIGFVYGQDEAVKWRPLADKRFIQDGASVTLWGIEQIQSLAEEPDVLAICEGEIDALTIAHATDCAVVSVPNGAPSKISDRKIDPSEDKKFAYLWQARDTLKAAKKIILCTDSDEAGEALREEIARRVGRAKCYQVKFPEETSDPNDVLVKFGEQAVVELIESAEPMPLDGVYQAKDYADKVKNLYRNGMIKGQSTGFREVDNLFTIALGQLSVVTGLPGSGKSEFIDQLMVNLAKQHGWTFAVASFENPPDLHILKLAEKKSGYSAFDQPKMSEQLLDDSIGWVNDHFLFIEQHGGDATTVDSLLDRISQACLRKGVRGCVIDPYNYITQNSGSDENEHQFINKLLTRLVSFARAHDIHIWFVAHPAKMPTNVDGSTGVPKGMNISGSASFFAKADLGITVHRNGGVTEIHAWKVRFKWQGSVGMCRLNYNIANGRYEERTFNSAGISFGGSRNKKPEAPEPKEEKSYQDVPF